MCEQSFQCPEVIVRLTYFIGYYFYEIKEFSKAVYFTRQAFIISDVL